jgi:hypothetical protein
MIKGFDDLPKDVKAELTKNNLKREDIGDNLDILLHVIRFCMRRTFVCSTSVYPTGAADKPPPLVLKIAESLLISDSNTRKYFSGFTFGGKGYLKFQVVFDTLKWIWTSLCCRVCCS